MHPPTPHPPPPLNPQHGKELREEHVKACESWADALYHALEAVGKFPVFWSRWPTPAWLGASSCWSLADCRCSLGMCSVHWSAGETWHGPCWRESPEWCHALQNASPSSWAKTRTWRSAVCETNSGEFDGQDPPLGHVFIGHDDGHPWPGFVEPFESCLHLW